MLLRRLKSAIGDFFMRRSAISLTMSIGIWIGAILPCFSLIPSASGQTISQPVPREHPRLLGSLERLQRLAKERPEAYQRVVRVAREVNADNHAKMISMAIVCAVESDEQLGKLAVQMAMKYINGPIRRGHVTFGHDLARCAIVYDL